ncbi:MaoC family dehydratase [Pseudooceanicola aestuarii]|uniref:MaoC family dehydratase n=1 Tax=Pseudooceanicola aestuarii TaxID=2697319 RepID=UPI0013D33BE4|nr:MaoC family dehydratase [Pseudooceanicola aestuarii]
MTFPKEIPPLDLASDAATAQAYAALTQDWNPIHLDPEFAAGTPFGRPIAHGTMALNLLVEAVARAGLRLAELEIRFTAPTYVGQRLTATAQRRNGVGPEGAETGAAEMEEAQAEAAETGGMPYDVTVLADGGTRVLSGTALLAPRRG